MIGVGVFLGLCVFERQKDGVRRLLPCSLCLDKSILRLAEEASTTETLSDWHHSALNPCAHTHPDNNETLTQYEETHIPNLRCKYRQYIHRLNSSGPVSLFHALCFKHEASSDEYQP